MKELRVLTLLSFVKMICLLLIASFSMIALAPDEAQYWTWSQALDWGYYSKPPGISWQIFLTTSLFGSNEVGVRLGAMLIGTALSFALFFLAKYATRSLQAAFFAAVLFALSPMGFYLSFAATTDGGALLFLTLALIPLVSALQEERKCSYGWVGLWIALGALFKWTTFFLWPFLFVALYFFPLLRDKKIFLAMALSLLGLLPTLYWNYMHEGATFKHVFSTLFQGSSSKRGNFFEYLAAQIGLFSPLFFLSLYYVVKKLRISKEKNLYFLSFFLIAALLPLLLSFSKKMQPNWALYLYPPIIVLMGWSFINKKKQFWMAASLSVVIIMATLLLPYLQEKELLPLSYKINPYRQTMGVRELTDLLIEGGYQPNQDFLFADKYQNSSLLSFYGPKKQRAYFFNLLGIRKNQFSFWQAMDKEKGKDGFFLLVENCTLDQLPWYEKEYKERLAPYFASVNCVGKEPLFQAQGKSVKHAILFHCKEYNGLFPQEVKKY